MPLLPSRGQTRAQQTPARKKRAVTNPEKKSVATSMLVRGIERPIYPISDLKRAFREASKTPQARTPKTRYARSKASAVSTLRIRDIKGEFLDPQMVTEGSLEPLYLKQCELNAGLKLTLAQPFVIDFEGYRGLGLFTMDFACYPRYGKPFAVDVKQSSTLDSAENGPLIEARTQALKDFGFELRTPTEETICAEPMCTNVLEIYACLGREQKVLKKAARQLNEALIAAGGTAPLGAFAAQLPPRTIRWGAAYGLYSGQFFADHSAPFGSNFVITKENDND